MNRPKKLLIHAADRATADLLAAATANLGCTTSFTHSEDELRAQLEGHKHDFVLVERSDVLRRLIGPEDEAAITLPLHEIERRHITRVLAAADGNRSRAARVLGIDAKTLYNKLKRYQDADERARKRSTQPTREDIRRFFD